MQLTALRDAVYFIVRGSSDNVSSTLTTQVDWALNAALSQLTNRAKLQMIRKSGTITLVADQQIYDLPAGFQKLVRMTVWSDSRPEYPIDNISPQDYTRYGFNVIDQKGDPEAYWIEGYDPVTKLYQIRFNPTPGTAEAGAVVNFKYYGSPAALSDPTDEPEIPEFLHHGLVHGAIVLGLTKMVNPTVLQFHQMAWKELMREATNNQDPLMGRAAPSRESSLRNRRNWNRGTFRNFEISP